MLLYDLLIQVRDPLCKVSSDHAWGSVPGALVEDFKENSLYKVQKSEHNAFDGVELEAVAGEGPEEDEEGLELYLEDLEAELEDGKGAEEDAEEL